MSSKIVHEKLKDFLNSDEAGVFVIKGRWGVGKTHVVQEVVKRNRGLWKSKKYAYISLFGINSIEEFRESIFVEMESNKKINGFTKTVSDLLNGVGTLEDASARLIKLSTKIWMHKAIPGSKICVDDMERRGDNLSIRTCFASSHN